MIPVLALNYLDLIDFWRFFFKHAQICFANIWKYSFFKNFCYKVVFLIPEKNKQIFKKEKCCFRVQYFLILSLLNSELFIKMLKTQKNTTYCFSNPVLSALTLSQCKILPEEAFLYIIKNFRCFSMLRFSSFLFFFIIFPSACLLATC